MIKYTSFKKTKVRFSDEGKGRAIVLLHGFLESHEIWKDFSKQLSKRYRVITIDLPGHGETHIIGYVHTMELLAKCVKAVMNSLKLRKYLLVGHSMGGYAAIAFADLFPKNVVGVCLFHSSARADSTAKKTERERTIQVIKKNHVPFIEGFFEKLFAPENVEKHANEIKQLRIVASKISKQSIVNTLEGMKVRENREALLKDAAYPVLFIIGKKDVVLPYEGLLEQSFIPKNSYGLVLENAGHMGFLEDKEATLKAIKKFAYKCYR